MRYLVVTSTNEPLRTDWFDLENNYNEDIHMIVFDLYKDEYTSDGKVWHKIVCDYL
jgi:hypothetical protein